MGGENTKELTKEQKEDITNGVAIYVRDALYSTKINDIFVLPQENKIAFLQYTRKEWKKSREVGGSYQPNPAGGKDIWTPTIIEYIPVRKIERLLNFLFNFNWESKVIKTDFTETEVKTGKKKDKDNTLYDAYVIVEFTCEFLGREIKRTVCGSFKMYSNPATTKFAVIQAAISQSKRNFAKEFGIGADLNDEDIVAETRFTASKELSTEEVDNSMDELVNKLEK